MIFLFPLFLDVEEMKISSNTVKDVDEVHVHVKYRMEKEIQYESFPSTFLLLQQPH